jgi:virulence-associated protein VagC
MAIHTSKIFRIGGRKALLLPEDIRWSDDTELAISCSGDIVTVYPVKLSLKSMVSRLSDLARPPAVEARDNEPLPESPTL